MHRLQTYILSACLTVGACLLSFGALEAGLRLFYPQIIEIHPNGLWQLSKTRGVQLTPGFDDIHMFTDFKVRITINEQGYRDRVYGPKPPGVFRILTIGDSFTFGFGVEQHEVFSKVLETMLNQRKAGAFEVINGGAPGYSSHQELIFLKEIGPTLNPDLVIVGLFPYNDLADNQRPLDRYEIAYGYLYDNEGYNIVRESEKTGLPIPFKGYLWAHSHAYRLLADRYRRLKVPDAAPEVDVGRTENTATDQHQPGYETTPQTEFMIDEKTRAIFRDIADVTEELGGQAVMMLISDVNQADSPESVWKSQWDQLKHMAALNDMPVIDLAPVFLNVHQAGDTPDFWYLINNHWNASGHRLVAETVYEALLTQNLIPGASGP